uniref:Uncharacterized protein n=1 Tax=Knipowitschia caucasica TaxID=637954 RepID=A0AAV2MAA8_KNICA
MQSPEDRAEERGGTMWRESVCLWRVWMQLWRMECLVVSLQSQGRGETRGKAQEWMDRGGAGWGGRERRGGGGGSLKSATYTCLCQSRVRAELDLPQPVFTELHFCQEDVHLKTRWTDLDSSKTDVEMMDKTWGCDVGTHSKA